VTHIMR